MAPIRKESVDQFRISFPELVRAKRGEPVQVDPYLIARTIALVMRECTVRSASGKPLLWNEYRMVLARADFELVRALQGPLERDLDAALSAEARAREAELVGALRVTVVYDEADELRAGQAVVRVAFVPTARLVKPRAGDMTVRLDGWKIAGEIAAVAPAATDTVLVADSDAGARAILRWPGGEAPIALGATTVIGRPHDGAPPYFVALAGASSKVNKQHAWITLAGETARIGRFATANPVHVGGQPVAGGTDVEVAMPVEISLSRGELVLTLSRR
jgi:hypothetical protein